MRARDLLVGNETFYWLNYSRRICAGAQNRTATLSFSEIRAHRVHHSGRFMDPRGIEPRTRLCHSRVLPLYYGPVPLRGIGPLSSP